jgi:multidrug resistance efflux pump
MEKKHKPGKEVKLEVESQMEAPMGGRQKIMQKLSQNKKTVKALVAVTIIALVGGLLYWQVLESRIYIENSVIKAPVISLTPVAPGVLDKLYVTEGDRVRKNQVLAKIGSNLLTAKSDGLVITVMNTPGKVVSQQEVLVSMINPKELKVIGHLDEDKGLDLVLPGQKVIFTVDAFGSREYQGFVESIAPSASSTDIVFNIADTRQENVFDIKVNYDKSAYPELRNGMSARMWVYR